ncbi:unnamed protein product [Tenebrio molitor]|nr:unnamed protein product [Tenebrio molitor]
MDHHHHHHGHHPVIRKVSCTIWIITTTNTDINQDTTPADVDLSTCHICLTANISGHHHRSPTIIRIIMTTTMNPTMTSITGTNMDIKDTTK